TEKETGRDEGAGTGVEKEVENGTGKEIETGIGKGRETERGKRKGNETGIGKEKGTERGRGKDHETGKGGGLLRCKLVLNNPATLLGINVTIPHRPPSLSPLDLSAIILLYHSFPCLLYALRSKGRCL